MSKRLLGIITLFASLSTLVCCAIPALLVSLGLGAALVSMLSTFPQLIWLSEHKLLVFGCAGALLVASAILRMRPVQCPTEPEAAAACGALQRTSRWLLLISWVAFAVGSYFAFVAPNL